MNGRRCALPFITHRSSFIAHPSLPLVKNVSHGAGLADFGGVEFSEDVPFGDIEAVDTGVETVRREPELGVFAAQLAVLGAGAVGAELFEIDIDNVGGIGHAAPPLVGDS